MEKSNSEKSIVKQIKKSIESFDIRKLILESCPPFDWCTSDRSHPIEQLGYYYFGIGDGFTFNESKVLEADELILWKLYALIQAYWLEKYQEWLEKEERRKIN